MSTESLHDFSGYEPTTINPGWSLTAIVIAICILLNCSLPILVRVAAIYDRLKAKRESERIIMTTPDGDERNASERGSESDIGAPALKEDPARSKQTIAGLYLMRFSAPSVVSNAADSSNVSIRSNVSSSVLSQVSSAILGARPHKLGQKRHKRYKKNNRSIPIQNAGESHDLDHVSSVCSKSVMSNLDHDDVSIQDAIDARDGNGMVGENVPVLLEEDTPAGSMWGQFLEIADWDAESKRLTALTIPYTIQGCVAGVFAIINVAIIGHYLGVMQQNAYVVTTILLEMSGTLTYGFGEAIGNVVPHALGTKNNLLVGRYLQLAVILYALFSIPGILVWSFFTDDAVLWFGFDEETAALSQRFAYPFLVMMFFDGFDKTVHQFLDVTDHEKYSTIVQLIYHTVETVSVVVVVALGVNDLVYVGIVQAFFGLVMTISNLAFVLYRGWLDDYWEGFSKTLSLRDARAVRTMLITAIPLSISWLLTYGEWEVLTIFASAMGPAEVAAWGMLGFIWDTFENLTAGFADAAEVRVGFRMGSGQPHSAKIAAYKSMYIGVGISILSTGGLFIIAGYLPGWITPDPTLQRMIFDVLPLMGFGQISLIIGTLSWGIVGAQGRVRLATAIEFSTSWFVAIPLCAISLYVLNYDIVGFAASLVFSYTAGGIVLGFVILRSDWGALSQTVISRNAIEGVTWEDNDWEELPPHVKTAAEFLGYTKHLWDNDEEPASNARDWDDLNPREKEAARIMGFNRRKWDDESDTSDGESQSKEKGKYDHMDWKRLPPNVQKAAKKLGYTKNLWDTDQEPHSSNMAWDEMGPSEQDAASILGYNKKTWDGDSRSEEKKTKQSTANYDSMDWKELPLDVRAAAKILGYDKKTWDKDGSPPSDDKYWHKLTQVEKDAAGKLGYTQSTWDDDSSSSSSSNSSSEERNKRQNKTYDDVDWNDLPKDVRAAAEILGYTKKIWDADGSPASDDKYWHKLTHAEKEAAGKLGYTQRTWDDDNSSSDDDSSTAVRSRTMD